MRIAVAATYDVTDVHFWSGTSFYIYNLVKKHYDVTPVEVQLKRPLISMIKGFYYNRIRRERYYSTFDLSVYNFNKKNLDQIFKSGYDIIITYDFFLVPSIAKYASHIILVTDATFDNLLNYYDYRSNLCSLNIRVGHAFQKETFEKITYALFSSDWAISNAVGKYKANREKFKILVYGSNLSCTIHKHEIKNIVKTRLAISCVHLFFPAINWERKGGDYAIAIINKLNEKGFNSRLIIAGCEVPASAMNKNIINVGFLDKRVPEQEKKLTEYYKGSHFLIMPTKADCTPIVFTEANSFALPIITSNTGGIPSIVNEENNNGVAFNLNDQYVEKVVRYIIATLKDCDKYKQICYSCYDVYQQQFNWSVGEKTITDVIESIKLSKS